MKRKLLPLSDDPYLSFDSFSGSVEEKVSANQVRLLCWALQCLAPRGTTMREIYLSAFPYMGCSMLLVVLLIIFPELALWLTRL